MPPRRQSKPQVPPVKHKPARPLSLWVIVAGAFICIALLVGYQFQFLSSNATAQTQHIPASSIPKPKASPKPKTVKGKAPLVIAPRIIQEFPHDSSSFTQGFEFVPGSDSIFLESAGLYGKSKLKRVRLADHHVEHEVSNTPNHFAEGLSIVGDTVYQLTWREHDVLVYDLHTLELLKTLHNPYDGWGLCFDSSSGLLVLSDGSDTLRFMDPVDFKQKKQIKVRLVNKVGESSPLHQINELECVGDQILANVWMQDFIVSINKDSGYVSKILDLRHLPNSVQSTKNTDAVLNGIARSQSGKLFVTGKLWSTIYEIDIS
jgi:glutamine cyclotransferase